MTPTSAYPGQRVTILPHTASNGVVWTEGHTGIIVDVFPGVAIIRVDGGWTHPNGEAYPEFGFEYGHLVEEEVTG